jgi:cell division protein FtsB
VWIAFEGGEFSTLDIVRQRRRLTELSARADSMQRVVDSLRTQERLVRTDPATQERIAREEFGMVRGNEILYRFATPDSDSTTKR